MADRCWALVPVKRRADCKSRLAGRLGAEARLSLVRFMLEHVLGSLAAAPSIGRIAVVSPERDNVPPEIAVLGDAGRGLNEALNDAQREILSHGASELVVLPADLPMVTAADIESLVRTGRQSGFALAADVGGTGTNALFLPPAAGFRFQFGPGSCQRHVAEAIRLGLRPGLVRARGLEFDVDTIGDLIQLERVYGDAESLYPPFPMEAHG